MDKFSYDFVCECLVNSFNLTFARYGDGEWNCILGKEGKNCDGHCYFPDMGSKLKSILLSKPYYFLGIQPSVVRKNFNNSKFRSIYDINEWVDNEVFTRASRTGLFKQFFDSLKGRNVIQVGNEFLEELDIHDFYVKIPLINCWNDRDRILKEILGYIKKDSVILYSSGMPTKYFIDEVYKLHGNSITQLDCGSVFDYYVGRISRGYMKEMLNQSIS